MRAFLVPRRFADSLSDQQSRSVISDLIDSLSSLSDSDLLLTKVDLAKQMNAAPSRSILEELSSPIPYRDWADCYLHAQLVALFKKRSDLDLSIDTAHVAFDTFLQSERMCRETNRILRSSDDPRSGDRAALLFNMQRKISAILGPVPELDTLSFGFGPGANVGCSKSTNARGKLSSPCTATVGCVSEFLRTDHSLHAWPGLSQPKAVRGSRWTTVPKTSLTDRSINIEPILNCYMQKGVGSYIRNRLGLFGVDLRDQTVNQRLARRGSLDGSLATIDLSMASDTVSYNLVMDLLPWDWFTLLDNLRSPQTELPDGTWWPLEKFSSMGNGYTFELESMIFYAVLLSVCGASKEISVYGDDLICPVEKYCEVVDALSLLGFVVNSSKSFSDGSFRESCGKDYWDGTDVRPCFLKERMSTKEIFRIHNFFIRTGLLDSKSLSRLLRHVNPADRIYGPDGFGDGHLIGDFTYVYHKKGWCGRWSKFQTWQSSPRNNPTEMSGDYGAFLYLNQKRTESSASLTMHQERSIRPRYRKRTLFVRVA